MINRYSSSGSIPIWSYFGQCPFVLHWSSQSVSHRQLMLNSMQSQQSLQLSDKPTRHDGWRPICRAIINPLSQFSRPLKKPDYKVVSWPERLLRWEQTEIVSSCDRGMRVARFLADINNFTWLSIINWIFIHASCFWLAQTTYLCYSKYSFLWFQISNRYRQWNMIISIQRNY